ncbi:Cro/CI family transcriptional regulator [Shewanella algae]|uniref:Cro/CI family transcriptional regulator n=1 Tax=Shewanella algae TaxID=38313 RepID=UPI0011825369|nr:Cro/CI family transcriptional regulator [Shewanella algae]TVL50426.1 Cro/Cl family transcriptional regulator [Shewanella algae]
MKTKDAVDYFGSKSAVAKRAGVSRSRVSQWGEEVPELQAYRLERASNGDLKADDPQNDTVNQAA